VHQTSPTLLLIARHRAEIPRSAQTRKDEEDEMTERTDAREAVTAATNGNKPPVRYESAFTRRVAMFPRVAYYPLPGRGCLTAVAMVINELLIGAQAAANNNVTARLHFRGAFDTKRTVFGGLPTLPREDVHIWRLSHTPGSLAYPDVADVVWDVRSLLPARMAAQVAPNHVLIPSQFHSCPWGPPDETPDQGSLPPHASPPVRVAVIDSGYMTDSPINAWVLQPVEYGQWFTATPSTSGQFGPPYVWTDEPKELRDANEDSALDALVAHADFVAGVIAQACPRARITVVDHNGAFVVKADADTPIPTEASVARSLWQHRKAQVINVGFAFATLPNAQVVPNTTDMSGPPSWTFELALQGVDSQQSVVVCPAGNQACPIRQYPAAFHLSSQHPNVIGVGSITAGKRSVFSNYGPWVACCTEGEKVLSTFYAHWHGKTEDEEPAGYPNAGTHPIKQFSSGWARWSGTSFAAPKVAAAVANKVGPAKSPPAAWLALKAEHPGTGGLGMGNVMAGLPPV
jgi:hypothetical protein